MRYDVTLIPGDGIGPEISAATQDVISAAGIDVNWITENAGAGVYEAEGTPLPQRVLDSIEETGIALKGPTATPLGSGFRSVNVALRKAFDLYSCVRPCHSMPGDGSRYFGVDLVIVRENTEDLYAGIEFAEGSTGAKAVMDLCAAESAGTIKPDSAISIKPISISASERIIRYAFDYAVRCRRKKVTAVHKANIMKETDGLFMHLAQDIAKEYPGIEFNTMIIDACCMSLVSDPRKFDVLVLPNLYGDIVSDLCAGLVGGLGLAPGANIGKDHAIFEATHGSAPDIAGKDLANPTALILSAAMMLEHLGEDAAADHVRKAVREILKEGKEVTKDIAHALQLNGRSDGSYVGTRAFGEAVAKRVAEMS